MKNKTLQLMPQGLTERVYLQQIYWKNLVEMETFLDSLDIPKFNKQTKIQGNQL